MTIDYLLVGYGSLFDGEGRILRVGVLLRRRFKVFGLRLGLMLRLVLGVVQLMVSILVLVLVWRAGILSSMLVSTHSWGRGPAPLPQESQKPSKTQSELGGKKLMMGLEACLAKPQLLLLVRRMWYRVLQCRKHLLRRSSPCRTPSSRPQMWHLAERPLNLTQQDLQLMFCRDGPHPDAQLPNPTC